MNVLLVTTSYPLSKNSPSGIFVQRLKSSLDSLCSVDVVCPDDADTLDDVKGVWRVRYGLKKWQSLAHKPGGIPAAIKRDRRYFLLVPFLLVSMQISIIRHLSRCDVIFANWAINALIAWLPSIIFGKPLITTFRGEDVRNLDKGLQAFIVKMALLMSDKVVLVSKDMETALIRRFPDCKGKLEVIHNGVDSRLLEGGISAEVPVEGGRIQILTVASLIPRKDINTLINAIAIINKTSSSHINMVLNVVGGGELEAELQVSCGVKKISNNVVFHGELAPVDVERMYRQAQLFVLPSLFEGRPNVVVEAMAAGCCVIVSDIDGSRELIGNEKNGLIFPVGNAKVLAEKILSVTEDSNKRIALGNAGRDYVIRHGLSWSGCASTYYQIFDELSAA